MEQGWRAPITVSTRSGYIIKGHGRLAAARELGVSSVPVDYQNYESDADEWADMIADNRIAELAEMDMLELNSLLDELSQLDAFEMELTGYTADEQSDLFKEMSIEEPDTTIDAEPQVEHAAELCEKWKVKPGQLWSLGDHRLLCGDSTKKNDVEILMGGDRADICLTDPPYGLGKGKESGKNNYNQYVDTKDNLIDIASKWLPIAREICATVVFSPGVTNAWIYPESSWIMCWFYGGGPLRSSWGFSCWQPFLCYGKDPSLSSGHGGRPDAVNMNTPANSGDIAHPCPKPLSLWLWFIERLSFKNGEIFYDPFIGSGTTIIASEQLGRKCYGMEIDPGYCAVTLERYKEATGKTPRLI